MKNNCITELQNKKKLNKFLKPILIFVMVLITLCVSFMGLNNITNFVNQENIETPTNSTTETETKPDNKIDSGNKKIDPSNIPLPRDKVDLQHTDLTVITQDAGYGVFLTPQNTHELWTWGNNDFGQLGLDTQETFIESPTKIDNALLSNFVRIRNLVVSNNSVFLEVETEQNIRHFWVWGNNTNGQLGVGDFNNRFKPTRLEHPDFGVKDCFILVLRVFVNSNSLLVLNVQDEWKVYTWGRNSYGEVGDGTTKPRLTPFNVKNFSQSRFPFLKSELINQTVQIYVGGYTGSSTTAGYNNIEVWTWGDNRQGQAGSNQAIHSREVLSPLLIFSRSKVATHFVGIGKTWGTIGITEPGQTAGRIYVWGFWETAQIKTNTPTDYTSAPLMARLPINKITSWGFGESSFVTVDATQAFVQGKNNRGQLGLGDTTARTTFERVTSIPTEQINGIGFSDNDSSYIWFIPRSGVNGTSIYTSGDNTFGQLGIDNRRNTAFITRFELTSLPKISQFGMISVQQGGSNKGFTAIYSMANQTMFTISTSDVTSKILMLPTNYQVKTLINVFPLERTRPPTLTLPNPTKDLSSRAIRDLMLSDTDSEFKKRIATYVDIGDFATDTTVKLVKNTIIADVAEGTLKLSFTTDRFRVFLSSQIDTSIRVWTFTIVDFFKIISLEDCIDPITGVLKVRETNITPQMNVNLFFTAITQNTIPSLNRMVVNNIALLSNYLDTRCIPDSATLEIERIDLKDQFKVEFHLYSNEIYKDKGQHFIGPDIFTQKISFIITPLLSSIEPIQTPTYDKASISTGDFVQAVLKNNAVNWTLLQEVIIFDSFPQYTQFIIYPNQITTNHNIGTITFKFQASQFYNHTQFEPIQTSKIFQCEIDGFKPVWDITEKPIELIPSTSDIQLSFNSFQDAIANNSFDLNFLSHILSLDSIPSTASVRVMVLNYEPQKYHIIFETNQFYDDKGVTQNRPFKKEWLLDFTTTGLSATNIVLIVTGVVFFITLIVLCMYVVKNKKQIKLKQE